MNTIVVWVLMAYAHGWTPTIEFNDQGKCEAAAIRLKQVHDSKEVFNMVKPYCVRIEK